MSHKPLVVVGASAGGVESLQAMVSGLPADFAAPVLVVLHIPAHLSSQLPAILARAGPLPAEHPADGQPLQGGHIYVAPPDHHLLVRGERVAVTRGPRENRFRPSADALFRSAAYTAGPAAIGVVLSGVMDDGTSGLWTIKQLGGTAIVQDPAEAAFGGMPESALQEVEVDHILHADRIGPCLQTLLTRLPTGVRPPPLDEHTRRRLEVEVEVAAGAPPLSLGWLELAAPSPYSCPECHGVLMRVRENGSERYRCHVGHAYSAASLLDGVSLALDAQLGQSARALEEAVLLLRDLHERARRAGDAATAARCALALADNERRLSLVRRSLNGT